VPRRGSILIRLLRGRAISLALVICLSFLLAISIASTAAIHGLGRHISANNSYGESLLAILNFGVSTTLMTMLFAAIFKILPNHDMEWRDATMGAVGTAVFFQFGHMALAYLLSTTSFAASYGAVGGVIALLLWAFYSAQVFLLGAEFTKVFAAQRDR
jgi:membrane protein